ncbi:hypothetical protein [Altibacter lentus]|uniref:hypothetical protein n=1 Tax=Altibacter lentus TaxID=1223410 RepID=UPI00054E7FF5|nr:hypothetical protein [Altibacter lentus]
MHLYSERESQNGSHFFIKSNTECQYLLLIKSTEEEYEVDFLENHIQNAILNKFTIDNFPKFCECDELILTIRKIIFNHVKNNDVVVKIEFEQNNSRRKIIDKYFKDRPSYINGLTHIVNGNAVYYFFSNKNIDSADLIKSLVSEFNPPEDKNDEEE